MASLHIIGFRVDGEMLGRIQAMKPRLSRPWHEATTSDIVRVLLMHALRLAESGSEIDGMLRVLPGEAPSPPCEASADEPQGDEEDEAEGAPSGTSARAAPRGHAPGRTSDVERPDPPSFAATSTGEVPR